MFAMARTVRMRCLAFTSVLPVGRGFGLPLASCMSTTTPPSSLPLALPILGPADRPPKPPPIASAPLPMSRAEALARGWDEIDIVFVTGDAYVDHPSFAMALLGRLLESEGFRVGIVSQPDWKSCEAWKTFGRPRLFFAVGAGNMDSMINHYTANRKVRNDDAYSPAGQIGRRPDRATLAYCQRATRSLSRCAGDCRRCRSQPAPPGPLRLLER